MLAHYAALRSGGYRFGQRVHTGGEGGYIGAEGLKEGLHV